MSYMCCLVGMCVLKKYTYLCSGPNYEEASKYSTGGNQHAVPCRLRHETVQYKYLQSESYAHNQYVHSL